MTKHTDSDTHHELLVELAYDEIDPLDANAAHTQLDEHSRQVLEAFRAVRADLHAAEDLDPAPSRVAFVALAPPRRPTSSLGRWTRGATIAASFLMGLLLTAAVANVRIGHGDDGWSFSTGLWPAAASPAETGSTPEAQSQAPATSPAKGPDSAVTPVSTALGTRPAATQGGATEADFDRWFNNRIRESGLVVGDKSVALSPDEVTRLMQDRERVLRQEYDTKLAGMFQAFDAQRSDDQLFIANEFGLWQENTGVELDRMNQVINYLISRVATDQKTPERRDD